jgi:hypothetical protein
MLVQIMLAISFVLKVVTRYLLDNHKLMLSRVTITPVDQVRITLVEVIVMLYGQLLRVKIFGIQQLSIQQMMEEMVYHVQVVKRDQLITAFAFGNE